MMQLFGQQNISKCWVFSSTKPWAGSHTYPLSFGGAMQSLYHCSKFVITFPLTSSKPLSKPTSFPTSSTVHQSGVVGPKPAWTDCRRWVHIAARLVSGLRMIWSCDPRSRRARLAQCPRDGRAPWRGKCSPRSVRCRSPRVAACDVSPACCRLWEGNARHRRGLSGDRATPLESAWRWLGGSFPTGLPQPGTVCREMWRGPPQGAGWCSIFDIDGHWILDAWVFYSVYGCRYMHIVYF